MVTHESLERILQTIHEKHPVPQKPKVTDKEKYFEYMYKKLEREGMKRYRLRAIFPHL